MYKFNIAPVPEKTRTIAIIVQGLVTLMVITLTILKYPNIKNVNIVADILATGVLLFWIFCPTVKKGE